MGNKLFIDTNVFLDLILNRGAFGGYAKSFFLAVNQRKLQLLTSISCIQTTIYILERRKHSRDQISESIFYLCQLVDLASTHKPDIVQAIASKITDLEDAILYYTAISSGCDTFITQNIKDFPVSTELLQVTTPQGFIDQI